MEGNPIDDFAYSGNISLSDNRCQPLSDNEETCQLKLRRNTVPQYVGASPYVKHQPVYKTTEQFLEESEFRQEFPLKNVEHSNSCSRVCPTIVVANASPERSGTSLIDPFLDPIAQSPSSPALHLHFENPPRRDPFPTPTCDYHPLEEELGYQEQSQGSFWGQLVPLLQRLLEIRRDEEALDSEIRDQELKNNTRRSLFQEDDEEDDIKEHLCGKFRRSKAIRRKRREVNMGNRQTSDTKKKLDNHGNNDDVIPELKSKSNHKASKDTPQRSDKHTKFSSKGKDGILNGKKRLLTLPVIKSASPPPVESNKDTPTSNSGDSIITLSDSQPSDLESVNGPPSTQESSTHSSSVYVDTYDKFLTPEDGGTLGEADSILDEIFDDQGQSTSPGSQSPDDDDQLFVDLTPLQSPAESPADSKDLLSHLSVQAEAEDVLNEAFLNDVEGGSCQDTHEDASSCDTDNSPEKEMRPKGHLVTRSFPSTPMTPVDSFYNFSSNSGVYKHERFGSMTNVRSNLSTIGSVNGFDNKLGEADEDDEFCDDRMFQSTTSLVVPKFRVIPHQKVNLQSSRFRTPPPVAARKKLSNSELCLRSGENFVSEEIKRYGSQNLMLPTECDSVLKRVASLTLDKATIEKKVQKPKIVPEKLDFSLFEKFEGQVLVNWFCSSFGDDHPIRGNLSQQDMRVIAVQFCTHLLTAGVVKQIEDDQAPKESLFLPDHMYLWSKKEHSIPASSYTSPGKISSSVWPPEDERKISSYSEKELQHILQNLKSEHKAALERIQKEEENNFMNGHAKSPKPNGELQQDISRLELQVEKYHTLAGIEALAKQAQHVSSPTSNQEVKEVPEVVQPSAYSKSSYTQTDPPNPCFSVSTQFDVTSTTVCRYSQTDSARCFSTGVQTASVFKSSVQVQTDNVPDPIHGIPSFQDIPLVPGSFVSRHYQSSGRPSYSSLSHDPTSIKTINSIHPPLLLPIEESPAELTDGVLSSEVLEDDKVECPTAVVESFVPPPPPPPPWSMVPAEQLSCPPTGCSIPLPPSPTHQRSLLPASELTTSSIPPPPPPPPPPPSFSMIPIPPPPPPPPPPPFGSLVPPPPPPPPPPGSNFSVPPPPPPPPGCGIPPPPPPPPGCGIPPPPPPPGCGIPPPPPPPGLGIPLAPTLSNGYHQPVPIVRKSAVAPKKPMRPLYWCRIQITTPVTPDEPEEGTTCLWEKLEETAPEKWDEFEELFSKQTTQKKVQVEEKKKQSKSKEVAKLLDQKRSQNVGILISSLHLDISEIEHSLYNFDTSVIDTDTLQSVYDVRPTKEELKTIIGHITSNPDVPLDKPEQFLYSLSRIPEYCHRIECIMFHSSFSEVLGGIENRLNNMKMTCGVRYIFL